MQTTFTQKIKMLSVFFLFCFVSLQEKITAQVTIGGTSTTTQSFYPIYSCYGYNYSQQIYTSAEILAAGGTSGGTITQIAFRVGATAYATTNFANWTIYLGNTTLNNFTGTAGWIPVGSMSQVWTGNIPTLTAGGWMVITLTTPFTWTGGNLVVAVDENTASYTCTQAWYSFTATAAAGPRSLLYYSDVTNPNPAAPPTANYSSTTVRSHGGIWIEYRWRHRIPVAIFSRQCNLDEYSRRHSGELHRHARQYNLLQITNYLFE